jgi:hypothetical protein
VRRLLPELPLHGAPDWWVDAVNDAAKQMTFIPGYHDGKPVPMQFVQPMLWFY